MGGVTFGRPRQLGPDDTIEGFSCGVGGWLVRNAPSQIPVILLGMLGVDARRHGEGLGHGLLVDAAQRASAVARSIGARALVVDPADDSARAFSVRHGFRPIPGSNRLFAKL